MEEIYFKQKNLFDPQEEQKEIHIYGCGSIGSHLAIGLTKTGFKDITIYDFDTVEASNIPAQFYFEDDIDKKKTEAIKETIKQLTGKEIKIKQTKINKETKIQPTLNSIHVLALDNIETRKIIQEKLDGLPAWLIDGRIGGFSTEKYTIKCDNDKEMEFYKTTLNGTFAETPCGEKCLWGVNSHLASRITAEIIKIHKEKNTINTMEKTNFLSDITIKNKIGDEE